MGWPSIEPIEAIVTAGAARVAVRFRDGKLAHEHIYWDQASVLAQLGLIETANLPVAGVETAEKVLDPSLPANELMEK